MRPLRPLPTCMALYVVARPLPQGAHVLNHRLLIRNVPITNPVLLRPSTPAGQNPQSARRIFCQNVLGIFLCCRLICVILQGSQITFLQFALLT